MRVFFSNYPSLGIDLNIFFPFIGQLRDLNLSFITSTTVYYTKTKTFNFIGCLHDTMVLHSWICIFTDKVTLGSSVSHYVCYHKVSSRRGLGVRTKFKGKPIRWSHCYGIALIVMWKAIRGILPMFVLLAVGLLYRRFCILQGHTWVEHSVSRLELFGSTITWRCNGLLTS